jgi:hypothetical protein
MEQRIKILEEEYKKLGSVINEMVLRDLKKIFSYLMEHTEQIHKLSDIIKKMENSDDDDSELLKNYEYDETLD